MLRTVDNTAVAWLATKLKWMKLSVQCMSQTGWTSAKKGVWQVYYWPISNIADVGCSDQQVLCSLLSYTCMKLHDPTRGHEWYETRISEFRDRPHSRNKGDPTGEPTATSKSIYAHPLRNRLFLALWTVVLSRTPLEIQKEFLWLLRLKRT